MRSKFTEAQKRAAFFEKVEKSSSCWEWKGAKNEAGYGLVVVTRRRQLRAHRVAYELIVGPFPDGKQADHLCRNRGCVRPKWHGDPDGHVEPVTQAENIRRGEAGVKSGEQQRAKTRCPFDHMYAGPNLFLRTDGRRECRECMRTRTREQRRARRARQASVEVPA